MTWRSLAAVGNLSSASVMHVLRDTIEGRGVDPPEPGTAGMIMAMGPGFCAELVLVAVVTPVTGFVAFTILIALVAVERVVELVVSKRNLRWSRAHGGVEYGHSHYPYMVALHVGLLVGCAVEVWVWQRPLIPALSVVMLVLVARLAGPALVVHRDPGAPRGTRWWSSSPGCPG